MSAMYVLATNQVLEGFKALHKPFFSSRGDLDTERRCKPKQTPLSPPARSIRCRHPPRKDASFWIRRPRAAPKDQNFRSLLSYEASETRISSLRASRRPTQTSCRQNLALRTL